MIRNRRGERHCQAERAMEVALMKSNGRIYRIPKAPFEPMAQVCQRGSSIIQQTVRETECSEMKKKEWIHASFLTMYQQQGLRYAAPTSS